MVAVKAKADLFSSSSGLLEVAKDSIGDVLTWTVAPLPMTWQVRFTTGQTTVTKWVTDNDVVFMDGPIGPARAVLERQAVLYTISYPTVISDTDIIIGNRPSAAQSVVQMTFSTGATLQIEADLNTGDLKFTFV